MASPLLASIDARIAAARNPLDAACLRAERAGLLARQGDLDEARAELAELHARHDRAPDALVSAWLHLADGLVLHFTNESTAARDRMLRSLALSTAIQAREVLGLSAAWLAHMDFAKFDFESMVKHVRIAVNNTPEKSHQALSRVSMVIAQTFHWCERFDLALPWYMSVRMHATAERDEFMLSAYMHNMAWMRCAQARRSAAMGKEEFSELSQAHGGANSTSRYDELVGTVALVKFVPILHAQILVLQKKYVEALAIYEKHFLAASEEGLDRLECCLVADRAWCRLNTGDHQLALQDAYAALREIKADTQLDDRAMTHTLVGCIFRSLGEETKAKEQLSLANADWQELKKLQDRLVPLLSSILPKI